MLSNFDQKNINFFQLGLGPRSENFKIYIIARAKYYLFNQARSRFELNHLYLNNTIKMWLAWCVARLESFHFSIFANTPTYLCIVMGQTLLFGLDVDHNSTSCKDNNRTMFFERILRWINLLFGNGLEFLLDLHDWNKTIGFSNFVKNNIIRAIFCK